MSFHSSIILFNMNFTLPIRLIEMVLGRSTQLIKMIRTADLGKPQNRETNWTEYVLEMWSSLSQLGILI